MMCLSPHHGGDVHRRFLNDRSLCSYDGWGFVDPYSSSASTQVRTLEKTTNGMWGRETYSLLYGHSLEDGAIFDLRNGRPLVYFNVPRVFFCVCSRRFRP